MSKSLKLVLLIGLAVVLAGSVLVGGFRYWLTSNESRFKELRERAHRDASLAAASTDAEGCVAQALKRSESAQGLMATAENKVFLSKCLELAKRPGGFCQGLPGSGELIRLATWTVQECARRGYGSDQECPRLLQAVPAACEKPPRLSSP
jgi:hypothetical protein